MVFQAESRCRAFRIGNEGGAAGEQSLLVVARMHVDAQAGKVLADQAQSLIAGFQRQAEGVRGGSGREIIGRGSESAGDDDDVSSGGQGDQGLFDIPSVITDAESFPQPVAVRTQLAGDAPGVGVGQLPAEQLIADGQYRDIHGQSLLPRDSGFEQVEKNTQGDGPVNAGDDVVEDDPVAILHLPVEPGSRRDFADVEEAKKQKTRDGSCPGEREKGHRGQIPDQFVDNDATVVHHAIVFARLTGGPEGEKEQGRPGQGVEPRG